MFGSQPDMVKIREALEASWDNSTSYQGAMVKGVPSLGQCYPTSRVLQILYPRLEIVEGQVWTGKAAEKHFWNILAVADVEVHIDLTWQQFPAGSTVEAWHIRSRETLNDSPATLARVETLWRRVLAYLANSDQL